ncbi:hypothetical protein [Pseudobacteriovorax antillogorgiicola]|uniref:hypothetical protein n=1 Tax=Pseudobacteriovorax antillogorgiicola TaxID=1513793 RepID=UPI0010500060|nr:hypothetical protein [Pseudobacteriovorax antillogorgiicola]
MKRLFLLALSFVGFLLLAHEHMKKPREDRPTTNVDGNPQISSESPKIIKQIQSIEETVAVEPEQLAGVNVKPSPFKTKEDAIAAIKGKLDESFDGDTDLTDEVLSMLLENNSSEITERISRKTSTNEFNAHRLLMDAIFSLMPLPSPDEWKSCIYKEIQKLKIDNEQKDCIYNGTDIYTEAIIEKFGGLSYYAATSDYSSDLIDKHIVSCGGIGFLEYSRISDCHLRDTEQ